MDKALQHLLSTIVSMRKEKVSEEKNEDVINVSETVSAAASVYETIRNTLEYDEEHLLRRNAIRRILKRRLAETDAKKLSAKLIKELIWARYLENNKVPSEMVDKVADILQKYKRMFGGLHEDVKESHDNYKWLLDVLSTEIEYALGPPCIDEALASYAYQELKKRTEWRTKVVDEADQDLQMYIAVHRAVLKSNIATLRYRILTLYYPKWRTANSKDDVVNEIALNLKKVIASVEEQIGHKSQDAVFRFVRRHAVVFRILSEIAQDNPEAFIQAVNSKDTAVLDSAISAATNEKYSLFRTKIMRTVVRAMVFLLLTKSILVFLVEYPYEVFVLQTVEYLPLAINVFFPPLLLAVVGLSVRIPKSQNTAKITEEIHSLLGLRDDFSLIFKRKRPWVKGPLWMVFNLLYVGVFAGVVLFISRSLGSFGFNALSIFFFIFFLSLVAYFGLRIRNTRRELMVFDPTTGFLGVLADVLFLPIVRAGRWVAMRAPRVNIFLFFFDFIIEAPFKAAIDIIESWLGFLREKREEI